MQKIWSVAVAGSLACSLLASGPRQAAADDTFIRDFLGAVLNAAAVANARKSWERVDPQVRNCLASQYNISADNLFRQGVTAEDHRVVPYVRSCEQAVAQARLQQEELQRQQIAREQAAEDARRLAAQAEEDARRAALAAEEQARQVQMAAEAEARRAQAATEAAAKAQRDAKRQQLVGKYGEAMADLILAGQVRVGMTKEQVLAARGNPQRRQLVPPSDELWVYEGDRISISGGKVTYIAR